MIQKHLKQLETELELDPFHEVKPGTFSIELEEGLTVTLSALQPEGFSLISPLGAAPTKNEEDFLTEMMKADLFGQSTADATLGLSDDYKTVILSRHLETDVGYEEFKSILEDFLNAADTWRLEIAERNNQEK